MRCRQLAYTISFYLYDVSNVYINYYLETACHLIHLYSSLLIIMTKGIVDAIYMTRSFPAHRSRMTLPNKARYIEYIA